MNLAGLRDLYRMESRDNKAPYFVSDDELNILANEAEQETCRRANLIVDSTSSIVTVTTSDALIEIDPRIIAILRVKMTSSAYPLYPITVDEMDDLAPGWEDETGQPEKYVIDYQTDAIRLYPAPTTSETITFTAVRLPESSMAEDDDEPEIRSDYHASLVQWMLYRVYTFQDVEIYDPTKGAHALANFEREFGSRSSARNEQWQREMDNLMPPPLA